MHPLALPPLRVTVNVSVFVPLFPSVELALAMLKLPVVSLKALERLTRKVSSASNFVSPFTVMEIVWVVSPGLNVRVPLAAV